MLHRQLISPFRRRAGGWGSANIALTIDYTATQFDFKFKLPSTSTIKIYWGDGTSEDVVGQDGTEITKTSSYSGAGEYEFWISGDDTDITYIKLDNDIDTICNMSKWFALTSLTHLFIEGTMTLSGALPTGLTTLYLYGNSINWTYNGALPTGLTYLYLIGAGINWTYNGALPTSLTYLYLNSNSINWTYNGALPTGITYLYLNSNSINWTYNGALPTGITYLRLIGAGINWTYNGALPTGLTSLYLYGNSINWTYNGALPTGLTYLYLYSNGINWTYNGALPTGLTTLYLYGNSINWTGLDIGDTGDISTLVLYNYRVAKMSSADMITLLTQMENRTGSLPATVTINDFQDYASPPVGVTDAVDSLKTAKSITTVTLGA